MGPRDPQLEGWPGALGHCPSPALPLSCVQFCCSNTELAHSRECRRLGAAELDGNAGFYIYFFIFFKELM